MPPTTVRNLELAIHDLKHSNYFRVWFLTFIAVFVVFWVGDVFPRLSYESPNAYRHQVLASM